ncbi:FAD-binding oxidoreductase [Nonomuraea antimicrobica]|uniref:FAD-binding oxidoreductase n=1 Tax=Nonomuraea antimicrobica TaxID=561173 RepID=A0ABP7B512_9ACTN
MRTAVQGEVLTPRDAGYEDARALHNSLITRRPAAIVRVSGTADVVTTLAYAREHALEVSVRGGGHGLSGRALGGDLVIDLSALRGVTVDPDARTAVVQGGATWADVDQATQAHGLAVPGGRISHTGVAGLTLGGGEGWLSAKHGLTCDNLIAAEVVTADGRVVVADDRSEPELMWALRGGGGNFGVVTAFTFRLHPVGPLVLGGIIGYRVADAPAVLGVLDRVHSVGHDAFAGAAVFLTAPPAPFVPGHVVGRPILAIAPVWLGPLETGAAVVHPIREAATPLFDAAGPMPYLALQSMLDDGALPERRNRWSAEYVPDLTPRLIADLQDAAMTAPSPLSQVIVSPLPDAVRTAPDSAFPSRDGGRWLVHPVGVWTDPDDDDPNFAWVDKVTSAVREHEVTGTYLNLEAPDDDRVRWAMGETRYRRLQRVKAAWDPDDVFRHCAHVSP